MIRLLPVKVATTSPLTVTLPDGATVPAIGIEGLSYPTSGKFLAIWGEGQPPIVLPSGTTASTGTVIDGNA